MAWMIVAVFLSGAALMFTKKISAILALPLMSLVIALLVMHDHPVDALKLVFETGTTRLANAMTNVIFGAMLAQVVFSTGIAETIVKKAAELAGDRTLPVALVMTFATAVAFLALTGLGSVIMIGTLVLPILLGVGLRPRTAASIFLFGIAVGGGWNVANWGFFEDMLKLPLPTIESFAVITNLALIAATMVYIVVHARKPRIAWAAPAMAPAAARPSLPVHALITPLIPVMLIIGFKYAGVLSGGRVHGCDLDINSALTIAALYGVLVTRPREILNTMTGAITEGIKSIAPVLALMMGIGMAVTVLMAEPVKVAMEPMLKTVIPTSQFGYVIFFGLLSPLALYRGPLNLYGLGAGIATILTTILSPVLVMGALMCTGIIQGVCDPTNTHNAWIGEFTKVDVNDILKSTLPYAFAATVASLTIIALTHWH